MKIYDGMRVLLSEQHREKAGDEAVRVIGYAGQFDWTVRREDTVELVYGPCSKERLQDRVDEGFYVPVEEEQVVYADAYFGGAHDEAMDYEPELGCKAAPLHPQAKKAELRALAEATMGALWVEREPEPVMPGGSPIFPSPDNAERKATPVVTGVFDYFPLALLEVAKISKHGNDQHNPGQPLHWARGKSFDHANCIGRHLLERGCIDPEDGQRHSAKLAWRALALLQKELELAQGYDRDAEVG